jgi:hypothetical protein
MQSTNLKEIKAALWEQAFIGGTQVTCSMGRVVQVRRRKGQLLAMIYGWGRWCPVEAVSIEVFFTLPAHSPPSGVNGGEVLRSGWQFRHQPPRPRTQAQTGKVERYLARGGDGELSADQGFSST